MQNPKLRNITAVAINPGNLTDSRALRTNTPQSLKNVQSFMLRPLRPILRAVMDPTLRTSATAGVDVADLAASRAYPGERGYFTMLKKDESSPESQVVEKQERIWAGTLRWARIAEDGGTFRTAF